MLPHGSAAWAKLPAALCKPLPVSGQHAVSGLRQDVAMQRQLVASSISGPHYGAGPVHSAATAHGQLPHRPGRLAAPLTPKPYPANPGPQLIPIIGNPSTGPRPPPGLPGRPAAPPGPYTATPGPSANTAPWLPWGRVPAAPAWLPAAVPRPYPAPLPGRLAAAPRPFFSRAQAASQQAPPGRSADSPRPSPSVGGPPPLQPRPLYAASPPGRSPAGVSPWAVFRPPPLPPGGPTAQLGPSHVPPAPSAAMFFRNPPSPQPPVPLPAPAAAVEAPPPPPPECPTANPLAAQPAPAPSREPAGVSRAVAPKSPTSAAGLPPLLPRPSSAQRITTSAAPGDSELWVTASGVWTPTKGGSAAGHASSKQPAGPFPAVPQQQEAPAAVAAASPKRSASAPCKSAPAVPRERASLAHEQRPGCSAPVHPMALAIPRRRRTQRFLIDDDDTTEGWAAPSLTPDSRRMRRRQHAPEPSSSRSIQQNSVESPTEDGVHLSL